MQIGNAGYFKLKQSDVLSPPASLSLHLLKYFTPFSAHLRGCYFYKPSLSPQYCLELDFILPFLVCFIL